LNNGTLILENCVLTAEKTLEEVPFYIHKTAHIGSQFPEPCDEDKWYFDKVYLPSKNVIEMIQKYGEPYYIKIDIENYDHVILRELFVNNIFPPYISAESHDILVFATLVAIGKYNSFKLVDGASVSTEYRDSKITGNIGEIQYSFPHHSAGPFGNDISGLWSTANNFLKILASSGLGWRDIHASNIDEPSPILSEKPKKLLYVK